ncbi:helix-turn-helix domain-containing protein [Desulfotruncus arcticus]|uniref:helix-turn-helix domain-containing protein n=1 Tax=Desulfotruncus arcticus TaxID=341036 RepID=UPI000B891B3F|nr:helix-turn-helix transcriptional regulator [Desulfotruncus arcticus]
MIKIHLSRLLGERKWTQAELARRTGIRPSTIGDYYHELVERINLNHLDKICEVLECEVSDILEYIPKRKRLTSGNRSIKQNRKLY